MPNADQPGKGQGRADDSSAGKSARPGSQSQNSGARGSDTGSDITGQKNKPGIGQPGRGGDDLSGRGTRHDDATRIDDKPADDQVQADAESGDRDKFDSPGRTGNPTGRGESVTPGSPPGGGSNPSSRQHSSQADTAGAGPADQMRSGQPRSTGEETLGGNQGAF